jgi:ParB family chromosome partitioning protein
VCAKKSALGKGLSALLGDDEIDLSIASEEQIAHAGIVRIPLERIVANPDQPRKNFSQESLIELADSIKVQGVISPILVKPGKDDNYIIVAGERRFRASRLAGIEDIPVMIRDLSDEETLEIALIENIQRQDLTPLEEARAYRQMMERLDMTQQEVAEKVGKNRSTVANSLRLLNLASDIQPSLDDGSISAGHARALLSLMNPADQTLLHKRIIHHGLSVREAEKQAAQLNNGVKKEIKEKKETSIIDRDPHIRGIEQDFIDKLGTKVQLKGSLNNGRIEIDYLSSDDLDRLMQLILN